MSYSDFKYLRDNKINSPIRKHLENNTLLQYQNGTATLPYLVLGKDTLNKFSRELRSLSTAFVGSLEDNVPSQLQVTEFIMALSVHIGK